MGLGLIESAAQGPPDGSAHLVAVVQAMANPRKCLVSRINLDTQVQEKVITEAAQNPSFLQTPVIGLPAGDRIYVAQCFERGNLKVTRILIADGRLRPPEHVNLDDLLDRSRTEIPT
jgi:hypothetical protein